MTRSCSEQFVKQESPVSRIYASDRGLAFFPTRAACIASGAISWQLKACSRDIYVGTNCPLRRRNRLTVEGVIGRRGEPAARKTAGVPSRGPQFFRHRVSRYREFFDRSFEKAVTRFSLSNPLSLSLFRSVEFVLFSINSSLYCGTYTIDSTKFDSNTRSSNKYDNKK